MSLKILFIVFFLTACNKTTVNNDISKDYSFSNKMSFNEFKIKLNKYADENPYPNIDE